MVFDVTNKVALVTGGARGLGFACAKELLKNNAKGVTIVDIDDYEGKKSVEKLNEIFGNDKAIFVHVDTANKDEFENAFKLTLDRFKNVDILVNNAGVLNEKDWEQCLRININGFLNGIILGMENYLRNHKSGDQAVIINTCSTASLGSAPQYPIYSTTKFAVMGMTTTWGHKGHFERTGVRVVAICPGLTDTRLIQGHTQKLLLDDYANVLKQNESPLIYQSAEHVGKEMLNIIKNAGCGSLTVVEQNMPPYEYLLPDKETFKKK